MHQPLRILHLTAGSDAGGLSRYILDLGAAMRQRGHQIAAAGQHGAWHSFFQQEDWPWIDAPLNGGPIDLYQSARTLSRHLRQHPVDLMHTHYRKATLVARILARRHRLPVLYTLHLSDLPMGRLQRRFSDFGHHTHTPSLRGRQWLTESARVPPERITLIPHGVDNQKFPLADPHDQEQARHELSLPADATVAAYVGRLDNPKNVQWMLDLADAARTRLPSLHVVIAGEGPHENLLRKKAELLRLADRIVFRTDNRDPLPVYQAADAVLLPSAREGFSLVCAEAMSVGRAVFRTQTAGVDEQIVEGITGRSVRIDNDDFIEGAITLMSDKTALKQMGHAAADHARQHLVFSTQVDQTEALYRRLVDQMDQ